MSILPSIIILLSHISEDEKMQLKMILEEMEHNSKTLTKTDKNIDDLKSNDLPKDEIKLDNFSDKKKNNDKYEDNSLILKTEDTGKIFEMAICLSYNIEYDGKFKYDINKAKELSKRLVKLPNIFPKCYHSARKGARYDFTAIDNKNQYLSAKSTKKTGDGRVAPSVIGQATPEKFCNLLNIKYTSVRILKQYIQENINLILPELVKYTFDSDTIYFNEKKNTIQYISLKEEINWNEYKYEWTCDWHNWKNSSTLKILIDTKKTSLLEVQFHSHNRKNMVIRWFYDTFLELFKNNLNIEIL
jgi:hypothetical protein